MTCNLQDHVIVITTICIAITVFVSMPLIYMIGALPSGTDTWFTALPIALYGLWLASEIPCIIGALEKNKWFLIPFIICHCLTFLLHIGLDIVFIESGYTAINNPNFVTPNIVSMVIISRYVDDVSVEEITRKIKLVSFLMLILVLIVQGLILYIFVIVVKFYKELSSGIIEEEKMVLEEEEKIKRH